ncbi:G-patch domain and KOW motifs-containing protein [Aplysia californica]|uniref:G-patch domain and KOW motifs-containing protein n=1 Tax=Aplysia californica TaxID=6500 RepID=A0ABM0K9Z8_APLCA|nr:G-patch domain and KOW motifs-containing protein [Aplysia californica]
MDDEHKEEKRPSSGFSFGFQKRQEVKQLSKSAVGENVDGEDESKDYVTSLEGKEVKSSKGGDKSGSENHEYVIPLIRQNKWRVNEKEGSQNNVKKVQEKGSDALNGHDEINDSLEQKAAKEILQETARYNETWEDRGKVDTTLAIPLLMQNKVPEGFESDEKLDVGLRPDEPHDADYDQIPIEHFGMAMLRGMGWNESRGIGKKGKVIAPVEAQLRPKGLGLGAERSNSGTNKTDGKAKTSSAEEEQLVLKKSAFCIVTSGVNKDLYGVVDGIDEDNSRLMVKLSLSGKTISIMQCNVRVVSKVEYEKYSKYINKSKADKYTEDEKKKLSEGSKNRNGHDNHEGKSYKRDRGQSELSESDESLKSSKHKHKKHKKDKRYEDDRGDSSSKRSKSERHHKSNRDEKRGENSKHERKNHSKYDSSESGSDMEVEETVQSQRPWLRNDLRVRIIDKDLKKGRYYKEKVVVVDVPFPGSCICRTDDGKVVEGVSQSSVETVIPRSDDAHVAIVSGSHRGQIGRIMKRDKDRCLALVQLLSDRDTVLKLLYDDICEYLGDVHSHEDY